MNDELMTAMWEQYSRSRDKDSRDALFEAYMPLSRAVARRFIGRGVELEDLEQVAGLALLKALERYDVTLGNRFSSYAVPTIAGALRNHLRDKGDLIRMPREVRQRLYRMSQLRESYELENGRSPSAAELAALMGISSDELLMLINAKERSEAISLDTAVSDDTSVGDLIGGDDESFNTFEQSEWLQWALGKVNETESRLLTLRYVDQLGQRDTAKHMGISQMQVSRLERRALTRLRVIEQSAAK